MLSDKNKAGSASLMQGQFGTQSVPFEAHDEDSIERITVLGRQLTNPYLIPNVQQAYHNLGIYNIPVTVTNLYVRFKPTNVDQLVILDSVMEAQDLDLFETPVDYEVLYEGDYYQDPNIPDEDITWLYAVVLPGFSFPAGITHETLAQIHIPADDYTAVETEAERLASIQDSLNMQAAAHGGVHTNVLQCPPGYEWSFGGHGCVPILPPLCPPGYHWNGTSCVADAPPPSPPAPAPDAAKPAGYIKVHDTNLNEDVPVRKARVVAKRWFKIQRTYTDNDGHFQITKRFKHKVKIIEKFKNSDAKIYSVRGIRIWQMIFPLKRKLGVYSGNKSAITFVNKQEGPSNSKANRYWATATVHNCVQEHKDYAIQFGFSAAPGTLKIFLTNWDIFEGLASTPLFHKRKEFGVPPYYVDAYMMNSKFHFAGPLVTLLVNAASAIGVDMAIDYHNSDLNRFQSDWLKETVYHELSHASQYTKLGSTWYLDFVSAELAEVYNYRNGELSPYGPGDDVNAPIIALGEAWGYLMGHFLADQRYGLQSSKSCEQFCYENNIPITGLSSHLNALENFDPNDALDVFHWIPKGLMYDLMDTRNEANPISDNVSGFTISQLFNAFQSDIKSIQQYRSRFIQQNPFNQTTEIINLFAQYDY